MTYSVIWMTEALAQLNRLVAANDPVRMRPASDFIDYALRRYPNDMGESRGRGGFRLWYGDVLGVFYHVNDESLTVYVIEVGLSRRPK